MGSTERSPWRYQLKDSKCILRLPKHMNAVSEVCFCLFVVFNPYHNLVYFKLASNYTNYFCKDDLLRTSESIFSQL